MIWISVALGGAIGACLRYGLFISIGALGGIPFGTFVANAIGAVAMGFLAAVFRNTPRSVCSPTHRPSQQ